MNIADSFDVLLWKSTTSLIAEICKCHNTSLPDFQRICRLFIDGKFNQEGKSSSKNNDWMRKEYCTRMTKNITVFFAIILSHAFFLDTTFQDLINISFGSTQDPHSDENTVGQILASADGTLSGIEGRPYPQRLVNECKTMYQSHPLTVAYFSLAMFDTFGACYAQVSEMNKGEETQAMLFGIFNRIKTRLVDLICHGFISVCKNLYIYEDWKYESAHSPESKDVTNLPVIYYRFQKYIWRSLHIIVMTPIYLDKGQEEVKQSLSDVRGSRYRLFKDKADTEKSNTEASTIIPYFVEKLKLVLIESFEVFLDGCEWLASHWKDTNNMEGLILMTKANAYFQSTQYTFDFGPNRKEKKDEASLSNFMKQVDVMNNVMYWIYKET